MQTLEVASQLEVVSYQCNFNGQNICKTVPLTMQCCITGRTIRQIIQDYTSKSLPVALNVLFSPAGDELGIHFADSHCYEKSRAPAHASFQLLVLDTVSPKAFTPLVQRYDTPSPTAQFLTATELNVTDKNRSKVAEAQYLVAVRFFSGMDYEKSNERAALFAADAMNNGHALGKELLKKLEPTLDLSRVRPLPAAAKYPEGLMVENVMLAFRELIAELPQPATVSEVKITGDSQPRAEIENNESCFANYYVVKRTYTITVVAQTPNGVAIITRKHDATLRPHHTFTSASTEKDKKVALGIENLASKRWGHEIAVALNPSHPDHSKIAPLIDVMTLIPDLFKMAFEYKKNNILLPDVATYWHKRQVALVFDVFDDWKDVVKNTKNIVFTHKALSLSVTA